MQITAVTMGKQGLELFVGPLEAVILRAAWSGATTTRAMYRYIREHYHTSRTDAIQFTSVTTTLNRMRDRGYFTRTGDKNEYVYTPAYASESEFINVVLRDVITTLFEQYPRETGKILMEVVRAAQGATR